MSPGLMSRAKCKVRVTPRSPLLCSMHSYFQGQYLIFFFSHSPFEANNGSLIPSQRWDSNSNGSICRESDCTGEDELIATWWKILAVLSTRTVSAASLLLAQSGVTASFLHTQLSWSQLHQLHKPDVRPENKRPKGTKAFFFLI